MLAKTLVMQPVTLHMYSKASEKEPLFYNYSHFIKGLMFAFYALSLMIAVTK